MIVDTSAIIAILKLEEESAQLAHMIGESSRKSMSAGSYIECGVVIARQRSDDLNPLLDPALDLLGIEISPVTAHQARIARQAYRSFGKGSGHAAQLNFGDCFAYALAMETGQPLLFKGDDFAQTDVAIARY